MKTRRPRPERNILSPLRRQHQGQFRHRPKHRQGQHLRRILRRQRRITPPLLLVLPQVRPLLARYAKLFAPGLNVLSYNEIPENREVSIVGTVG